MTRSTYFIFGLLLYSLILPAPTMASSPDNEIPNLFYDVPSITIENVVLGRTCISLPAGRQSLVCNPAMLAKQKKHLLRFNFFVDNHVQKAIDYAQDLKESDSISVVNRLLNDPSPSGAKAALSSWYQSEWWAVSFSPMRLSYVSETRNPAYPEISVHAFYESELSFKAGFNIPENDNLSLGFQARLLDRDYIREEIALLDAFANPERTKVRNQKAISLEPAAVYAFENDSWQPTFSIMLTDLQLVLSGPTEDGTDLVPEFGFASRPSFANGKLVTSTHFTLRRNMDMLKRLRWGALYETSLGDFSLSLAKGEFGLGFSTAIDSVTLGLAYKTEEVSSTKWDSSSVSSFMVEAGLRF